MAKKQPPLDFRGVRRKLPPEVFAIGEGVDVDPTDLVDEKTCAGIIHLPDDVAIRVPDHNGTRLELLYTLWGDWITAIGDPDDEHDELYGCMLDATSALQCTNFLFLHGFYRSAIAELRVALELVMIGAYGNLKPAGSASLSVLIGLIGLLGDKRACERTWIGLPGRTCGFLGSSETAIVG